MSFQELLSPQHYECLVKLRHNDAIVGAWYNAITNPLNEMKQDANALMWLVHMLCQSKDAAYDQLMHRKRTESPTYILTKALGPDEVLVLGDLDRPETCSKINTTSESGMPGPRLPRKGL